MDPDPFNAICSCKFHNHGFSVERHKAKSLFPDSVEQIICVYPGWFSQKVQYLRLLQLTEIWVFHKILQHDVSVRKLKPPLKCHFSALKDIEGVLGIFSVARIRSKGETAGEEQGVNKDCFHTVLAAGKGASKYTYG